MSEPLKKIIRRTVLQSKPWHIKNNWYGHIVYFTDGTKGEIWHCTEANPEWLTEGKILIHTVDNDKYPNKYADKPFLVTPEILAKEMQEEQENNSSSSQSSNGNKFQKRGSGNGGGSYKGGYGGRYEDSPDIWLQKQKFISMLKLYEVLSPLIGKGDIEYKNLKKEVDEHLEHILEKSGMNNLPPAPVVQHIPSHTNIQKSTVKHVASSSSATPAKKIEDNTMHTSREVVAEPVINPDAYSSESTTDLFAEDSSLKNDPAPADILDKISKCSKKAQLTTLQRSLSADQLKNRNIMNAFFTQKNKLGNKNK